MGYTGIFANAYELFILCWFAGFGISAVMYFVTYTFTSYNILETWFGDGH